MVIAIDFDNTICYGGYPESVGKPVPRALESIKHLQNHGHKIILHTCRESKPLQDAVNYLHNNGILPYGVNESDLGSRKVCADIYIDDKAINVPRMRKGNFKVVNWGQVMGIIHANISGKSSL